MHNHMKIMIVYDGSRCSEDALEDLRHAGLPFAAKARVVSVVQPIIPAALPGFAWKSSAERKSQSQVHQTQFILRRGCIQLERIFPAWEINSVIYQGAAEFGIIELAAEWQPHLIVINPLDRSGFERFILGDFAESVVQGASCSVRVARGMRTRSKRGLRLLIGFDGSSGAAATVCEVWSRRWPAGTQAHLIAAFKSQGLPHFSSAPEREWYLRSSLNLAAETLRTAGLAVTTAVIEGSPRQVILDEARKCDADTIFLGKNLHRGFSRLFGAGTSGAVASQAQCSVEVVRERMNDAVLSIAKNRLFRQKRIGYAIA